MRRGEGRSILLDLASAAGLVLAVFFFVYHHPLLAIAALVVSLVLSGRSGQAAKDGRIDEALAAKEEWDRRHPPQQSPENLPSWKHARNQDPAPDASTGPGGDDPPAPRPGS